jgi:hypothetical protein
MSIFKRRRFLVEIILLPDRAHILNTGKRVRPIEEDAMDELFDDEEKPFLLWAGGLSWI